MPTNTSKHLAVYDGTDRSIILALAPGENVLSIRALPFIMPVPRNLDFDVIGSANVISSLSELNADEVTTVEQKILSSIILVRISMLELVPWFERPC